MSSPPDAPPPIRMTDEVRSLLERLAEEAGLPVDVFLARLVRDAARRADVSSPEPDEPALVLESTDEVPAISPEGRGRKIRLKAIDETGEWDAGEIFVPDPPKR